MPREKGYMLPGLVMMNVTDPQTHACQPVPSLLETCPEKRDLI